MNQKIYFAGSIRGGREDASLYHRVIAHIQETDTVLTEHVGDLSRSVLEGGSKDIAIYEQDTSWLRESDLVIAECTRPSLGVGYELAYAEKYKKPVYIFYRHKETQLSAMLKGDAYFHISSYETEEELMKMIDNVLKNRED
jgi:nucleoside 2-deoxyribosyltransferase